MGWAAFIAIAGLITTLLAGPGSEWLRRRDEWRRTRRNERVQAATDLLDAYTAYGNYIMMTVSGAITPPAKVAALEGVMPLMSDFNTALHRAQLMLGDKQVSDQLDAIEVRVGEWYINVLMSAPIDKEALDSLHSDILDLLRGTLDV